jgi:hypothetical protein
LRESNRISVVLALASAMLAFPGDSAAQDRVTPSPIDGIYAVIQPDVPIGKNEMGAALLTDPNIDGVFLRNTWQNIQPRRGEFNWSYLDTQIKMIAETGKKASIGVAAGAFTPNWVYYEAGAQSFQTVTQLKALRDFCSPITLPVPWDPTYLDLWTEFIRAFGAHFANNRVISLVKMDGINFQTWEVTLPRSRGGMVQSLERTCSLPDDILHWQLAGYTSTKVVEAFRRIAAAYARGFPTQPLAIMTDAGSFPPIGSSGNIEPAASNIAITDFLRIGRDMLGARFVAQNNALSARGANRDIAAFARANRIGYQTEWFVTRDQHCYMSRKGNCDEFSTLQNTVENALGAHASYIELFPKDIGNPAFSAILGRAHRELTRNH